MDVKFRVFPTEVFDDDYEKLDHSEQLRVDKIVKSLFEKGDVTGKPLGMSFFREKKFDGKRVLYLVYESLGAILLVAIVDKKLQQATINEIILNLSYYQDQIINKLSEAT